MKKLTGIRLINWHSFIDEKINIKNSALLSGENGAGKSTILDAIQFILTCNKTNFNKAANDSSKRTLAGYVRYKTGREDKPYEREGDVTSHVALEFYDEGKKKYFVIGSVIDSSSETSEKVIFYRFENIRLEEIKFKNNEETPLDISEFKAAGKPLRIQISNSMQDGKKDFLNRLGRLNNKFLEVLPKSLAFKPIKDVKDFVYSYILDEKEVNIDALRENIRTFKEFEYLLKEVKEKIKRLDFIKEKFDSYDNFSNIVKTHEYIILLAEEEIIKNEIKEIKIRIDNLLLQQEEKEREKIRVEKAIEEKGDYKNTLQQQLNSNDEYLALKKIDDELKNKKNIEKEKVLEKKRFINVLQNEIRRGEKIKLKGIASSHINEFLRLSKDIDNINMEEFKEVSLGLETILKEEKEKYYEQYIELKLLIEKKNKELKEISKNISDLEKRNLQYPKNVTLLKEGITNEFLKIGKEVSPKILCELLEVVDPKWKNAVEGYLNTQRFYLLVEEENFDFALKAYERLMKHKGIHSVGLINTAKIKEYTEVDNNSLAAVVSSKNSDAKKYINMILGNVIRCDKVEQLKNYRTAITPKCMLYKNHVARGIDPKIYKVPFIGEDAYRIQLEEAKKQKESLLEEVNKKKENLDEARECRDVLEDLKYENLIEKSYIIKELREISNKIMELKKEKQELEINNNFFSITLKLQEVEKEIRNLDNQRTEIIRFIENAKLKKDSFTEKLSNKNKLLSEKKVEIEGKSSEIESLSDEATARYKKERSNKKPSEIHYNFSSSRSNYETRKAKALNDIEEKQREYNRIYELGAEEGFGGRERFLSELEYLKRSKIIEYEEQVKNAKQNAEEEFKEHFMSKLQENISIARREFKELNYALKGVVFGSDEYEFTISASKETKIKKFHDMIMDTYNYGQGQTLFSNTFQSKYKEELDELFDTLTLDEEIGNRELKRFTDYRTYMNYDIRIKHGDGSKSFFSKVCREKSGGETQTPFYVAMAASFVQLYSQSSLSGDPIGIILFDEAFDKMDDSRITAMMKFLNKLPLQLILAAPPQKIDSITPHVNTTLLAMKSGEFSLVEEWTHENI